MSFVYRLCSVCVGQKGLIGLIGQEVEKCKVLCDKDLFFWIGLKTELFHKSFVLHENIKGFSIF